MMSWIRNCDTILFRIASVFVSFCCVLNERYIQFLKENYEIQFMSVELVTQQSLVVNINSLLDSSEIGYRE